MAKLPNNTDLKKLDSDTAEIKPDKTKNAKSIMKAVGLFAQKPKKAKKAPKAAKIDADGDID